VLGRWVWSRAKTFAEDRVYGLDDEVFGDFAYVIDGFECGWMRGKTTLRQYDAQAVWEYHVPRAEQEWFSEESIAKDKQELAFMVQRLEERIVKMKRIPDRGPA